MLVPTSPLPSVKFPFKLHRLLEDAADQGNEHIVSWLPDGKSFKIHSKEEFEILILPRYYTTSFSPKYRSFCRQLTIYGFHRGKDPSVADFDAYSHPLFIRNMPALCQGMTREKAMHKKFDTIKDATEHGDKTREEFLGLAPLEERKEPALVPQEEVPMTRTQGDGLLEFAIIANKFLETKSSFQSMNDICRMSNDVLHDFQQQDHLKQQQLDAAFDGIKRLLILSYPSPSTAHV